MTTRGGGPGPDVLVVPVRIDALCPDTDLDVAGPSADFRRLPWVDAATGRDRGDDPYLSEILLPVPFEDAGLRLRPGVHLHWALPDALTRLVQTSDGVETPRVPDRWLVTRTRAGKVDGQWVVESDHLTDADVGGVAYPVTSPEMAGPSGRPCRFLGRSVPLAAWDPAAPADRLPALTAVGYGEPTFAGFYPNCHSVFGFHDPDGRPDPDVSYDVLGWYSDVDADELARVRARPQAGRATVADALRWAVLGAGDGVPGRTACYGRLTFAPARGVQTRRGGAPTGPDESGVWIADTATEALAAHLGAELEGTTPDAAENLLEALAYAGDLEAGVVDLPLRLATARHRTSFQALAGGTAWIVRRQDDPAAGPEAAQARDAIVLPPALDAALDALNALQEDADRAAGELVARRRLLACDWYRYLLCAYPPVGDRDSRPDTDEVAAFLRREVAAVEALATRLGTASAPAGLAGRIAAAKAAVTGLLGSAEPAATAARCGFVLQPLPAQPYRRPNEPVVLLTGSAARPTDRHGRDGAHRVDGLLGCVPAPAAPEATATATGVAALRGRVAALADTSPDLGPWNRMWRRPPWHPILLHWEAEFYPTSAGDNLDADDRDYHPDFVVADHVLSPDEVELRLRPDRATPDKAANVYSGSTVLSAGAWPVLSDRVLSYLEGPLLAADDKLPPGRPTGDTAAFRADPTPWLNWYAAADPAATDARLRTLVAAALHLADHERRNLAQSLGGFDDALLMLRLTRQLPIADPLGFPDRQELAAAVAAAVDGENHHAPEPLTDFNPIRAGGLQVRRLRIVDSFGVPHDVATDALRTTAALRVRDHLDWVGLPPRLAQPARLALRLLDARGDRPVTGLPTSSPVCGWLVPELLDDALGVHAADGALLGTLRGDRTGDDPVAWRPGWGPAAVPRIADVAEPHLRGVVAWLVAAGADGVGSFLDTVDAALSGIEPETAAHPGVRALLGRPLALVRVSIALELLGPPAVHHDWNVFRQDLRRSGRETNAAERVRFPVRVGEHGRLGDGVVGFWIEDAAGGLGPTFHDTVGLSDPDTAPPVTVTAAGPAVRLTLLVDPHGAVHATSGVLPVETVSVDAPHYRPALERLEVGFLAAPVLADADRIALPLATEPGTDWIWWRPDRGGWTPDPRPPAPAPAPGWPAVATVWEGRLTLPAPADHPAQEGP